MFVLGSNDYFAPSTCGTRSATCSPTTASATPTPRRCPGATCATASTGRGWLDLDNRRDELTVRGVRFAFAGVDDPHLEYDDLAAVAGPADPTADVRLGVCHAPYLRVLDAFAGDGYDAVLAGHTHGGQLCLPVKGAIVTNCDLDPARAKGLHRHPADSRPGDPAGAWLHVSAGLGTSPVRPGAVLLPPRGDPAHPHRAPGLTRFVPRTGPGFVARVGLG